MAWDYLFDTQQHSIPFDAVSGVSEFRYTALHSQSLPTPIVLRADVALPYGQDNNVGPVAGGQLPDYGGEVFLDCLPAHPQGMGYSLVGLAFGDF